MASIVLTIVISSIIAFFISTFSTISSTFMSLPSTLKQVFERVNSAGFPQKAWTSAGVVASGLVLFLGGLFSIIGETVFIAFKNINQSLEGSMNPQTQLSALATPTEATTQRPTSQETRNTPGTQFNSIEAQLSGLSSLLSHGLASIRPLQSSTNTQKLSLDIYEDVAGNLITADIDLPGIAKADVNISISDGMLIIAAKREMPNRSGEGEYEYIVQRRQYGVFEEKIKLPIGTKFDGTYLQGQDLKPSMESGVLSISFPRVSENASEKVSID